MSHLNQFPQLLDLGNKEAITMKTNIRIADSKGRISLPGFANATVIIEAVGASEFRVRKAKVIPEDELRFLEEDMPIKLSERDAHVFLRTLENPPEPTPAARRAARRLKKKYG
jgi:hypothetical protein